MSPIISGVISNVKKASAQRSIEGYIKAIELAEVKYQYKNGGTITRDISKLSIETNANNRVSITDIVINKKGIVESGEFEVDGYYCKYEDNKVSCTKTIVYTYSEIKKSYNSSNRNYFFDVSYGLLRESIQNLTFTDVKPSGTGHDVSAKGDESILLYYSLNANKTYDVTIYSKDIILAPVDSSYYFCELKNVINLQFNDRFDTSKVTYMSYMFFRTGQNAMKKLNLGDKFDTSSVIDMSGMFNETGSNAMTELDLGDKFDTSSVTNMAYMFFSTGYNAMTELDLGDKFDTSSVTNMQFMFSSTGYTAMTELDLGDKFDTSSVTNMQSMFSSTGYTAMTELDLGDKFDTSSVTNMQFMFSSTGYNAMTALDLGNKFDTSSVTNMAYMFYYTGNLKMTTLVLGLAFKNITTNSYVFYYTGKSGCIIKAHEDIYNGVNQFKLNKDSTTYIDYTIGTIQKTYLNTTTE